MLKSPICTVGQTFRKKNIKKLLSPTEEHKKRRTIFPCVFFISYMVGATGFEPTTSSTPRKRSTKLGYAPTFVYYRLKNCVCQTSVNFFRNYMTSFEKSATFFVSASIDFSSPRRFARTFASSSMTMTASKKASMGFAISESASIAPA